MLSRADSKGLAPGRWELREEKNALICVESCNAASNEQSVGCRRSIVYSPRNIAGESLLLFDLSCGRVSARRVREVGRARHHNFPSASSLWISMGGNECKSNRSRGIQNLLWAGGIAAAAAGEQIKIIWLWEQPRPNICYYFCPHSNRSRGILNLPWAGGTAAAATSEQIKSIWRWEQTLPNTCYFCPHSNRSQRILNLLCANGTAVAAASEQIKIIWWLEQPLPNNDYFCPHSNRSQGILNLLWAGGTAFAATSKQLIIIWWWEQPLPNHFR